MTPTDTADFINQSLDPASCFLCSAPLTRANRSEEHVFPKWLLRRCNLWDSEMVLLNRTVIRYRSLTIPCCKACNSGPLAALEQQMSGAFTQGAAAVRAIDQQRLFFWLAKFFYGLVFLELTLPRDRAQPSDGSILDPEILRAYAVHHLLLRGLAQPVRCNQFPASIFVFDALTFDEPKANFDYFDAFDIPFLSVRVGSVFVVACLQDWGAVKSLRFAPHTPVVIGRGLRLHLLQCLELTAYLYYQLKLFDRVPKLVIGENPTGQFDVFVLPLQGLTAKPLFREADLEVYSRIFIQLFNEKLALRLEVTSGVPTTLTYQSRPLQAPARLDWIPDGWEPQ